MKLDDFNYSCPTTKQEPQIPDGAAYAVVQLKQNNKQFSKWHDTLESAQAEAQRLAAQNNQAFGVVKLVGVAEPAPRPVTWTPRA